jgi:hypothetical protein
MKVTLRFKRPESAKISWASIWNARVVNTLFTDALIVILNFLLLVNERVVGYVLFLDVCFCTPQVLGYARQLVLIEFYWNLQYSMTFIVKSLPRTEMAVDVKLSSKILKI